MSRGTARLLVAGSLIVLIGVLAAVVWWPRDAPRADLVGSASRATSTTTAPRGGEPDGPEARPWTTVPATVPAATFRPVRLRVEALGIDAPIVPVGLQPDGAMEVPEADQVGWYEPGVRPGDAGSAVLAAHVDYRGAKGVFFDLRSLPSGSLVTVVGADGTERAFTVSERFQVDKDELPVDELFRTTGDPTITLVTCGGSFDRSVRHYRDNIVVRATPA